MSEILRSKSRNPINGVTQRLPLELKITGAVVMQRLLFRNPLSIMPKALLQFMMELRLPITKASALIIRTRAQWSRSTGNPPYVFN